MDTSKRKMGEDSLAQYVSNANEVINFKFVLNEKDLKDDSLCFQPNYTHQFFGDSENIFGYIGLKVDIIYSACLLNSVFTLKYRAKVKSSSTGGVEPDDVFKIITAKQELAPGTDLDAFINDLGKESEFKPFGDLLASFSIEGEKYSIFRATSKTPGFTSYHRRMETLILWFIDAASYIDDSDERWDFFLLHKHTQQDGVDFYPFVGYTTVYRYYAYPNLLRPRISQMLVLPPYQKIGLGSKLLETICDAYVKDEQVLDMTVEDPSDDFIRMRDYVDSKRCSQLESFSKNNLLKGFSEAMQKEAREKLKINKKQARRVYEILRLYHTDTNDPSVYRVYRLDIKNRLNIPFEKERRDFEKLKPHLSQDEIRATVPPMPKEQRMEQLEQMYNDLEQRYGKVVERLRGVVNGKMDVDE